MTGHRSRLCQFVIDVGDLDSGLDFWSAALGATTEPVSDASTHVYRQLRLPDSEIRILLHRTGDAKKHKERMHFDLETDDVEAEVTRLERLGATRWDHQQERGFDFWVLRDPWGNEFCVLQAIFRNLLAERQPWRRSDHEPICQQTSQSTAICSCVGASEAQATDPSRAECVE